MDKPVRDFRVQYIGGDGDDYVIVHAVLRSKQEAAKFTRYVNLLGELFDLLPDPPPAPPSNEGGT